MELKMKESNLYKIVDHNYNTVCYITASNIIDAKAKAKSLPVWKRLLYPSVKRTYDGGVRG